MILEILRVNFGILTSLLSLCILSYMDLRRKEVNLWMLLIYGIYIRAFIMRFYFVIQFIILNVFKNYDN